MNKLSIAILGGLFWSFSYSSYAQGDLINNGANIVVSTGHNIRVQGEVQNGNNGRVTNNGSIYLNENWTQTGTTTDYSGIGWLNFEGSGGQSIGSSNVLNIPRLRVNNNNNLTLSSPINVSLQVDLNNNGNILLGTHNLTLTSGASIIGADVGHYIVTNGTGQLRQTVGSSPIFFPIGNTTYNPATLSNTGTIDVFSIRVQEQALQNGTTGAPFTIEVVDRTWFVEEEVAGGSIAGLTLEWGVGEELTGFDRLDAGLMHYTGGIWDKSFGYGIAPTVGTNRYQITGAGITNFSPFGVTTRPSGLPVELLVFEAIRRTADEVDLNWSTATEINNRGFEVERMLDYETVFTNIGFVEGSGTSAQTNYYHFLDENSYRGISYYRLKQIDFDGSVDYSPTRSVLGMAVQAGVAVTSFPNPVKDMVYVRFGEVPPTVKNSTIQITDMTGRVLYQIEQETHSDQRVAIKEVKELLAGTYFITVIFDDGQQFSHKFIKTKI
jgi:hypothetical protein